MFRNRIAAVVVFLGIACPALAQSDWTYSLAPTAWGVGLNGSVSIGALQDEVRVTWTDGFGAQELAGGIAFEASNGRFGVMVEGIVFDMTDGGEPPSILTQTADSSLDHKILTLAGTWRIRKANPEIDAILGLRYIDVDADLKIVEDGEIVKQAARSEDWTDFIFGARVRQEFANRWIANASLDFGAGDSELSYQLILGVGYKLSSSVSLNGGYRVLGTDRQVKVEFERVPGALVNDFHYSSMKIAGPYLNLQFNF